MSSRKNHNILSGPPPKQGLYDPQFEHDACGVGFVVNIKGRKSHEIVRQALTILLNLDHRGACGCEANTGDGAGILIQMPHEFLAKGLRAKPRSNCPPTANTAWAWFFCRPMPPSARSARQIFGKIVAEEGQHVVRLARCARRTIPRSAKPRKASEPFMRQVFIGRDPQARPTTWRSSASSTSSASAPSNEIRYAGIPGRRMFLRFQPVVQDARLQGHADAPSRWTQYYPGSCATRRWRPRWRWSIRVSARTPFPSWDRAHPYRYIAHNGEINTLRGNINWMHARAGDVRIRSVRRRHQEDSADHQHRRQRLGDVRQLPGTARHGRPLAAARDDDDDSRAVGNHESMSDEKKAFYEYHCCLMEPWDGPASIAFTDGKQIGACSTATACAPRAIM